MDFLLNPKPASNSIARMALLVGAVSFAIGYVGPLLVSDSNLGPLLGIFVTGPLGFLAGALIGIILSARRQDQPPLKRELRWLAGAWAAALFFTWALAFAGIGWISIGAQLAVFICTWTLFYGFSAKLPDWVRHWKWLLLVGAALIILSSIFPPLGPSSIGSAKYAFFLDPRFDGSTRVPDYNVHQAMLLVQWLVIVAIVSAPIIVDQLIGGRKRT